MKHSLCYALRRFKRTLRAGCIVFIAAVAGLLAWSALAHVATDVLPGRWWLDVRSIRVEDAPQGVAPAIHVDRTIRRAFWGRWAATIWAVGDGDAWEACVASSPVTIRYKRGAPNPHGRDLDWWIAPTVCRLAPGAYQMTTAWEIALPLGFAAMTTADSHVFHIRPRPE